MRISFFIYYILFRRYIGDTYPIYNLNKIKDLYNVYCYMIR